MVFTVTQIAEDDWREFSQVRLRALLTDPSVFGSNFEKESRLTEADWREKLRAVDNAIFIVRRDGEPVGMTAASIDRNDPTKKTGIFWGSWLEPAVRGTGLSGLMNEARLNWIRVQPGVEKVLVSHRASNLASRRANQRFGFVQTHVSERPWPDRVTEREYHYELRL